MTALKVDITIGKEDPGQLATAAPRLEAMGFDGVGMGDFTSGPDVFTLLTVIALQTSKLRLFPCVANPLTRHPMVLANISHALDSLAPGRFCMMIGAANDWATARYIGRKPATVAEMRQSVTTVRKLLAGEPVQSGGGVLEGIKRSQAWEPPVSVAVAGPRMTELAGEIGDEVLIVTGHSKTVMDVVRPLLEKGAARAGRSLDGFQIADWAWVRVDDDEEAAFASLKSTLSGYLGSAGVTLDALGFDWPLDRPDAIADSEWRRYVEAVAFFGPAGKIAEQFQDLARSGHLDRIVCGISGPDDDIALASFAKTVLPRVK